MVIGLYLYKKYRKWKRKFSRISQNVLNWMNIPLLLWKEKFLLSVDVNLGHCKRPSLHATLRHGFIWLVRTFLIIWIQAPQVRLKMNDKKPSKFQLYFSGVLKAFSRLKKWKKKKFLLAWTSEIIQLIRYPIQMDRTERSNFLGGKGWLFIVIQLCYSGLWPFFH